MANESYKNGQDAKLFKRRLKFRKERAEKFRYPFGLLTVIDLICGTRKRAKERPADGR